MTKHIITAGLLSLFLITSCTSEKENNVQITPKIPVSVQVGTIGSSKTESFYTSSGKVQSVMQANISTRMMGYVQNIQVKLGDRVSKGQLLLKLNNKDIRAKQAQVEAGIAEAQAAFTIAEKDYKRFKSLFQTESASQKELDDITAHFQMAQARLDGANQMKKEVQAQMEYTNIRAPFSGVVSSKFINEGDLANPGMPLMSLENGNKFEVVTMVSEEEISQIKKGLLVDVIIKSSGKKVEGKVKEISVSSQNSGSQYEIKIALEKTDGLFTGMYAQVKFPIEKQTQNQVLLPLSSLVKRGQLHGVFVVSQQNTAILRWLRLGKTIDNKVEVLSGLNSGDKYIVSQQGKIENGTLLTLLN